MKLFNDLGHDFMEAAAMVVHRATDTVAKLVEEGHDVVEVDHSLSNEVHYSMSGPRRSKQYNNEQRQYVCPHLLCDDNDSEYALCASAEEFLECPTIPKQLGDFNQCSSSFCEHGWRIRIRLLNRYQPTSRVLVTFNDAIALLKTPQWRFGNHVQFYYVPTDTAVFSPLKYIKGGKTRTNIEVSPEPQHSMPFNSSSMVPTLRHQPPPLKVTPFPRADAALTATTTVPMTTRPAAPVVTDIPRATSSQVVTFSSRDECEEKLGYIFDRWQLKDGNRKNIADLLGDLEAGDADVLGPLKIKLNGQLTFDIHPKMVREKNVMKKNYMNAVKLFHPDKHHVSSIEEQYRSHMIFNILQKSWDEYTTDSLMNF